MKWSFSIGRVLGIEIRVHATFLLLLAFITVAHWMPARSLADAAGGLAFILALFSCVVLHEYGHALMARRYGVPTRDITLLPIGGVARLERIPDVPAQELWIAIAGPAVNLVIAALLAVWLGVSGQLDTLDSIGSLEGSFAARLLAVNLFLVAFNFLPAFPMDGGRVLRALLAMRFSHAFATRIAANVGQAMALVFGLVGLFGNPMLLLIALFVWIGAAEESAAAEMKDSLRGLTMADAMRTDFLVLTPSDTIGDAAKLLLAGSQRDFPVMDGSSAIGIVSHDRLIKALREHEVGVGVETIMDRDFDTASVDESLEVVLGRRSPERRGVVPVYSGARLVGMVTADNIGELFMIRSALASRTGRRGPPPIPGRGADSHSSPYHRDPLLS